MPTDPVEIPEEVRRKIAKRWPNGPENSCGHCATDGARIALAHSQKEERAKYRQAWMEGREYANTDLEQKNATLQAEVERLRAALLGMVCVIYNGAACWCMTESERLANTGEHEPYCDKARAALTPEEE